MIRLTGLVSLLAIFAADVASAQTLRYADRSNPGASQLSNHQYHMGTARRAQNRKFGYQRSASQRQRMSILNMRKIQRTAGQRGTRTGAAAEAVAQKRQQARDRITTRRLISPSKTTTRLQTATAQRAEARRQAAQRGSKRKSRTIAW